MKLVMIGIKRKGEKGFLITTSGIVKGVDTKSLSIDPGRKEVKKKS